MYWTMKTWVVLLSRVVLVDGNAVEVSANGAMSQADIIKRSWEHGCVDSREDCAMLAGPLLHGCAKEPAMMLNQCAKTCVACSYRDLIREAFSCDDTNPECPNWAQMGEYAFARACIPF